MITFQDRRPLTALALMATLAGGAGLLVHQKTEAGPAPRARDEMRDLSRSFRDVARNISPSVVGILATHEVKQDPSGQGADPFHGQLDERFWRFFGGDDFDGTPFQGPMPPLKGQGTGVIVD